MGVTSLTRRTGATLAKIAVAAALVLSLGLAPSSAAQNHSAGPAIADRGVSAFGATVTDDLPPMAEAPRLPDPRAVVGLRASWIGPQTRGVNYASTPQQWVRTPTLQMAVLNEHTQLDHPNDPTCSVLPVEGSFTFREWRVHLVFINADAPGGVLDRFGETQPFTVNTVAFGSIPVEATVAIEQPLRADGVVRTGLGRFWNGRFGSVAVSECNDQAPFPTRPEGTGASNNNNYVLPPGDEPMVRAETRLRVDALSIDGVELDLAGACRSEVAEMTLSNDPYYAWDPEHSPEDHPMESHNVLTTPFYAPTMGGRLFGSIDIGPFSGCVTMAGDDLSALLTATVSGPDNPVDVRAEGLTTQSSWPDVEMCPFDWNCEEFWPVPEIPEEAPEGQP